MNVQKSFKIDVFDRKNTKLIDFCTFGFVAIWSKCMQIMGKCTCSCSTQMDQNATKSWAHVCTSKRLRVLSCTLTCTCGQAFKSCNREGKLCAFFCNLAMAEESLAHSFCVVHVCTRFGSAISKSEEKLWRIYCEAQVSVVFGPFVYNYLDLTGNARNR